MILIFMDGYRGRRPRLVPPLDVMRDALQELGAAVLVLPTFEGTPWKEMLRFVANILIIVDDKF
jgi:hypothetical protein